MSRIKAIATALIAFIALSISAATPKHEMRGVWLVTAYGIDWPSRAGADAATARMQKAELDSMLTALHRAGFNAVFFQVRPMADALYESSLEPWSSFLTGARGRKASYDPLAYAVEACHRLGMECHAWINPFRVGTRRPSTALDMSKSHLWMTNSVSRNTMTIFNPALDDTRNHLCRVCHDIATRYDIDGIVFDDYFYNPEFLPEDNRASDWELFQAAGEGMSMAEWRRANVNRAMADVHAMLQDVKGGKLRFGISPQGIAGGNGAHAEFGVPSPVEYGVTTADSQYDKIYSDPVLWLREGIVDYVSPQIYWTTDNPRHGFGSLARWWNDVAEMFDRHCFASQTIAAFGKDNSQQSWDESLRQIAASREASFNYAPGSVVYSASYVSGPKCTGFGRVLADSIFSAPALVPPMRWKTGIKPLEVSGLRLVGDRLEWAAADDARYVVYAIPSDIDLLDALDESGDGFSACFIVGITYSNNYRLDPQTIHGCRIAVTPYDRYGVEWQPTFLQ